eukprot:18880-Amphidinium_carterae.1
MPCIIRSTAAPAAFFSLPLPTVGNRVEHGSLTQFYCLQPFCRQPGPCTCSGSSLRAALAKLLVVPSSPALGLVALPSGS